MFMDLHVKKRMTISSASGTYKSNEDLSFGSVVKIEQNHNFSQEKSTEDSLGFLLHAFLARDLKKRNFDSPRRRRSVLCSERFAFFGWDPCGGT